MLCTEKPYMQLFYYSDICLQLFSLSKAGQEGLVELTVQVIQNGKIYPLFIFGSLVFIFQVMFLFSFMSWAVWINGIYPFGNIWRILFFTICYLYHESGHLSHMLPVFNWMTNFSSRRTDSKWCINTHNHKNLHLNILKMFIRREIWQNKMESGQVCTDAILWCLARPKIKDSKYK